MSTSPTATASFASEGASRWDVQRNDGLLLVAGDGMLTTFPLTRDEIIIGRAPECDIIIARSALSRRHARLCLGAALTLEDLGSRNGTHLLGRKLEPGRAQRVSVGQSFQIGRLSLVVVQLVRGRTASTGGSSPDTPRIDDPTASGVTRLVTDLAKSSLSVLILGETGVGKEVLAATLHTLSGRPGALVCVNCAAIAPTLIESELFGHEKSAFTGATQRRVGLLEAAQGGTVFLDEVGELPEAVQAKLLRAIESREITRVGAVKPLTLDVRFVAATHRDLPAEVARGRFRSDLYYRLDGITLVIPPLRERRERIGPLALQFLKAPLDAGLLARLEAHDWPGNVRELKAVLDRAVILARGGEVKAQHVALSPILRRVTGDARAADARAADEPGSDERQRILDALEACAGNQTRAAKALGVSRATLVTKLAVHRIPRPQK